MYVDRRGTRSSRDKGLQADIRRTARAECGRCSALFFFSSAMWALNMKHHEIKEGWLEFAEFSGFSLLLSCHRHRHRHHCPSRFSVSLQEDSRIGFHLGKGRASIVGFCALESTAVLCIFVAVGAVWVPAFCLTNICTLGRLTSPYSSWFQGPAIEEPPDCILHPLGLSKTWRQTRVWALGVPLGGSLKMERNKRESKRPIVPFSQRDECDVRR